MKPREIRGTLRMSVTAERYRVANARVWTRLAVVATGFVLLACANRDVAPPKSGDAALDQERSAPDEGDSAISRGPSQGGSSTSTPSKQETTERASVADAAGVLQGGTPAGSALAEEPTKPTQITSSVELEAAYPYGARPISDQAMEASLRDTEIGMWNSGGGSDPEFATNRANFHAAVRVIVNATVLSGRGSLGALSARDVLAGARASGYWPYRLCYEDGLRAGTSKRGVAVLRLSANTRGRVTFARATASNLPPTVTHCLRQATYKLRFKAGARRRLDLELNLQLSPGDVQLPARISRTADASAGAQPPVGVAYLDAAAAVLTPKLVECYAPGVERDPNLWGRIQLRLRLDPRGRIASAVQLESRFPDPAVVACFERAATGLELEAPASGSDDLIMAWRLGQASVASQ